GFIHGFRYNIRALSRILDLKHHGRPLPHRRLPASACGLLGHLQHRFAMTSALWQQFGFLADAAVVEGGGIRYYESLPFDYIHKSALGRADRCLTLSLEFGDTPSNPFSVDRDLQPAMAHRSIQLHPVVRVFSKGICQAEHHVLEDLFSEWQTEEVHLRPLRDFLAGQLEPAAPSLVASQ